MRPFRPDVTATGERRPWQPPAVTKLPIGTQTKLLRQDAQNMDAALPAAAEPHRAPPEPPAAPTTKLGFAFEMAFPLSARIDD
jgi:hypothetical protein